jgi:hypothetical protein
MKLDKVTYKNLMIDGVGDVYSSDFLAGYVGALIDHSRLEPYLTVFEDGVKKDLREIGGSRKIDRAIASINQIGNMITIASLLESYQHHKEYDTQQFTMTEEGWLLTRYDRLIVISGYKVDVLVDDTGAWYVE